MANKYCDQGAYAAYAATPTWGVPQDGDGTANTASTTAATVTINMSTWVFTSGSSTFSVMGCTALTVGAGANSATNAQYSATLTTMIDNLVAAINAATAVIVNRPAGWGAPQVRNAVFARRTSNSLELMTRTGSASWGGLVAMTFTSVTNSSSQSWTAGTGGCWGYIGNTDNIWASAITPAQYGIWGATLPHAGVLAAGDVVKIRSGKTVTFLAGTNQYQLTLAAMGAAAAPVVFEIDDSTEWADGADPVLILQRATTGSVASFGITSVASTAYAHIKAKEYAGGVKSLTITMTATGVSTLGANLMSAVVTENVQFLLPSSFGLLSATPVFGHSATSFPTYKNCVFSYHGLSAFLSGSGSGVVLKAVYVGCEFAATQAISAISIAQAQLFSNSQNRKFLFDGCRFTGFVSNSTFIPVGSTAPAPLMTAIFRNCEMGNIRLGQIYLASTDPAVGEGSKGVYSSSQTGFRDFSYEDVGLLYTEWRYAAGRPTLNALLHDGVTPWSIYAVSSTVTNQVHKLAPVTLPRISKLLPAAVDLAEAARTFTLNFLLESTLSAWTKSEVSVLVEYVGTDGVLRVIDTYDSNSGALTTSTESWSATTWNGQTWLKRAFDVTTPVAVKESTEVVIHFRIHTSVANDTLGVILDPEVVIA